ncbi:hypothetical protein JMJ56_29550 [Belnapia sp. T18]|uniref:Uncharacterized protein n=1 Tax=Belnapia arida TaxID=2804533 RepID=A0ABS1UBR7_9PROT|nr:hypothetical protein [Belnapia arida]MBL6082126.1 hypothetical protein [Belnapia arida]
MNDRIVDATRLGTGLTVARKAGQPFVQGRRKFFRCRDLGVQAAMGGELRAQVMEAMTELIGWHTHQCEAQFIYILKDWMELEFEHSTRTRSEAGDAVLTHGGDETQRGRHLRRRGDPRAFHP